ncbi:MAG: amidohydrolase family protein [Acidimicrobiales bacterium]|nr:amidohydrolase family protein [Acidimicrobiales bacterium]
MSDLGPDQTPGLVCSHHHVYSALARGMPAPPRTPSGFLEILELVWWRLDCALDLDIIHWSAKLAALEALERGCTAIIDHHESPEAIDGSLSVIADACAEVGIRVSCAYGATDRHPGGFDPARGMTDGARRGLDECERFLRGGGRGMVGLHAAFTCSDATIEAAAGLAADLGVGVHVHVAEGAADVGAPARLAAHTTDDWLLIHGVHLADDHGLRGTLVHNPRSNMNNAVGYARPVRFTNPVALGTDGIGADMLDEFRVAYVRLREHDVTQTPETAWGWLATGWDLFPEARADRVTWSYEPMDPWRLAFSPGVSPVRVEIDGETAWADGKPTRVDAAEIRARAAEAATRLHARL